LYYTKVDFGKTKDKTITEAPGITFNVPTIDVTVVFNRGAQYIYKDVQMHDYRSFTEVLNRADRTSHGKAFNKFIKIYPVEKLEDVDIDTIPNNNKIILN
jgi:hypothetical protein